MKSNNVISARVEDAKLKNYTLECIEKRIDMSDLVRNMMDNKKRLNSINRRVRFAHFLDPIDQSDLFNENLKQISRLIDECQ